MADEITTTVCTSIEEKLQALSSTFSEHTIFRVPRLLYEVNEKAYEPEIISIGPYYRGKNHLKMMEVHKVRFLGMLLGRTNGHTAEVFVAALRGMVEKARNCYSESSSISTKDFLEMLVLDGCFIVELIHQLFLDRNMDEYVFRVESTLCRILLDLILFENQLPFFVLWELFGIIRENQRNIFVNCFLRLFGDAMPGLRVDVVYDYNSIKSVKHLLDLVRGNWLPSRVVEDHSRAPKDGKWSLIRSATELKEAGIRFKKGEGNTLFDIMFRNGVLEIPMITISDSTESLYRNVIVCEQFEKEDPKYLTEFTTFMDCLINSGKDVELLCHCGIIENWLGNDEAVATMFNRITDNVGVSIKFYAQICNDVNEHYNALWNKRIASLRHNYFNTPWAFISFLAAAFLLLLTLLQTTFTIFPRH
ncbi:hypothetical protein SLEP1_g46000 [Rubroshorea leprosula]|uniref:Uncharacterized protein n=1 Tax=Rubroshorea leprosula TaxID=152421 RepID=A0AAV5LME4_9ROSI|nr:hypothetical protein SLEP1_g46000 [Rubroshorea leprosula]